MSLGILLQVRKKDMFSILILNWHCEKIVGKFKRRYLILPAGAPVGSYHTWHCTPPGFSSDRPQIGSPAPSAACPHMCRGAVEQSHDHYTGRRHEYRLTLLRLRP